MNKNTGLGIVLILLACLFAWAAVAAEPDRKILGGDHYMVNGFSVGIMNELPTSENEEEAFKLMGIGCMHEIEAYTFFIDSTTEVFEDLMVVSTECVPFTQAPLLPTLVDSMPFELIKKDGIIEGNTRPEQVNAFCHVRGYFYTAFIPMESDTYEGQYIEERVVGIMLLEKSCTEIIGI